jgi:hypothetical protein
MHIIGQQKDITKDYNQVYFTDDDDVATSKMEMWIAKACGEKLVEVYPNRQWSVVVDIPGRMVVIGCPSLSQTKGYHILMKEDTIHDLQDRVIAAGGEIMERYGLSRSKIFNPDDLLNVRRLAENPDEAYTPDSDGIDPLKK